MKSKETVSQAIIDILVKHKVISESDGAAMRKAFKNTEKEYFDEFLMEQGLVDDINILRALSEYYKVPAFDVVGYFFDYRLLHKFPKGFLLRNVLIPLEVVDEEIMVMVVNEPDDADLLEKIGQHVSYDIQFRVGLRTDIINAIEEYYDKAITEVPSDADKQVPGDQDIQVEHMRREEVRREAEEPTILPYEQEEEIIPDEKEPGETEEE